MSGISNLCDFLQENLDWCEGEPQFAGMQPEVYYCAKQFITSMPTRYEASEDASKEPLAYASGDFKLKAGKCFHRIYIDPNKSQYTYEAQGEYPNVSTLNKLTLLHPGFGLQAANASAYINNHDCVFIFRDMQGRWRICGSKKYVGKNTVSGDGGQGPTGSAATTISVEQTDFGPCPFFQGSFETEDGKIECSVETNLND